MDPGVTGGPNLVLVRHGESEYNARGLLTGWADPGLTGRGREQSIAAGRRLTIDGACADVAFTSMLARARQTAACLLGAWGRAGIPVTELWELNERHLGQLQGLDKRSIRDRWGNAARRRWRDELDALPPPLRADDPRHPSHDPAFDRVPRRLLPASERLSDLRCRVLAGWRSQIRPALLTGQRVVVVAHRDSLRVLIAELEGLDPGLIAGIAVPPASPRRYRVDRAATMPAPRVADTAARQR